MHKRQAGFSAVEAILVIIILVLAGFSWYVFQEKKKAEDASKKPATTQNNTPTDERSRPDIPSDWVWFEHDDLGFAFAHPKAWTITSTEPESCPFDIKLYGSASCPAIVKLSPKDFTGDKRNSPDSSLLTAIVYEGVQTTTEEAALAYELDQAKVAKATVERQENSVIDGQKTFFMRNVTTAYTDNLWAIHFPGYYLRFTNRERNTTYYSDGKVSYVTDYARYTPTIERIIKTVVSL